MNPVAQGPVPTPARPLRLTLRAAFGVVGGPAAWFAQLCIGYWLASAPCFPGSERLAAPVAALSWTWPALIVLLCVCAVIAVAAFFVSLRGYRAGRQRAAAASAAATNVDARTRFLAFWGMLFGAGFCVATLLTVVAFATLPRCSG
jgi:hypothetical protein